jgi:hypothetical protein
MAPALLVATRVYCEAMHPLLRRHTDPLNLDGGRLCWGHLWGVQYPGGAMTERTTAEVHVPATACPDWCIDCRLAH